MTLLKREERACYLEHHKLAKQKLQKCYLAYLKKQNLQLAHCNRKQESLAYTLQQESYLTFAFEIFASLYVVNLLSYYLAYIKLDSLHDVILAKFSSL